ncbi:MAG TPA: chemotaxis protein CheW [bacterium]|nr:chemotaxis protein CheW [bacterium]
MATNVTDQTAQEAQSSLILTCYVGEILLGINALKVQEVIKTPEHTPVHHAPDYVIGVMNLRGRIVTLIDLGRRMDANHLEDSSESRIVIVDFMNETVGLLVDKVSDVITPEESALAEAPSNIRGAKEKFIQGICRCPKGLVAVLDTDRILSEREA